MPELEDSTFELQDVEIFAAGKWKGEDYTTQDLDNMVHNFDLLGRKYKAPLKLGHDDKQKLAQADGYPAIGWIKELKRVGDKLLATFTSVPSKIKQLIDKKAYGRFSSEILWNFNFGGNVHKRVLKAVALLGADMPAVTSINDIVALYTGTDIPTGELHAYHDVSEQEKGGGEMATMEEMQKQLEESKENLAKLSESLQAKDEQLEAFKAAEQERIESERQVKIFSAIDDGIKAGKIAPVQREYLAALALTRFDGNEQVIKFSDGKEELKAKDSLDVIGAMIDKLPVDNKFSTEQSTVAVKEPEPESVDKVKDGGREYSTDESLDKKIKAIQKEKNISYSDAYQIAISEVK